MTGRRRCPAGHHGSTVYVRRDNAAGIVALVATLAVAAVSITAAVAAKTGGGQVTGREAGAMGAVTVTALLAILTAGVLAQRRVRVCDACRRR